MIFPSIDHIFYYISLITPTQTCSNKLKISFTVKYLGIGLNHNLKRIVHIDLLVENVPLND